MNIRTDAELALFDATAEFQRLGYAAFKAGRAVEAFGAAYSKIIGDLQVKIAVNAAAISKLKAELINNPESQALTANLRSLRKLHHELTAELKLLQG